jgi:hypothetical protein
MKRWVFRLGLMGAFALTFGSCGAMTAEEVCEEHRALLNDIADRCGRPTVPEVWLTWQEGPCEGLTTSCAYVSRVVNPREVLDGCFPALETISCDDFLGVPGPEICQEQYEGVQGDRTTCTP